MATLTQEQINNYKRMGIPIPAGTTVYGQSQPISTAPAPAKTTTKTNTSGSVNTDAIRAEAAKIQSQINDLQAQQSAMQKYGVKDS
ncbi:MAG: hypothetical protein WC374_14160, partial [Phycisphaerae bacterium]